MYIKNTRLCRQQQKPTNRDGWRGYELGYEPFVAIRDDTGASHPGLYTETTQIVNACCGATPVSREREHRRLQVLGVESIEVLLVRRDYLSCTTDRSNTSSALLSVLLYL